MNRSRTVARDCPDHRSGCVATRHPYRMASGVKRRKYNQSPTSSPRNRTLAKRLAKIMAGSYHTGRWPESSAGDSLVLRLLWTTWRQCLSFLQESVDSGVASWLQYARLLFRRASTLHDGSRFPAHEFCCPASEVSISNACIGEPYRTYVV